MGRAKPDVRPPVAAIPNSNSNNFFVYGPKFTIFFDPTWEGW